MKSVVICEGNTDLTLIQYFLEKVYQWDYIEEKNHKKFDTGIIHPLKTKNSNDIKWLSHHNGSILCIVSSGGVSGIPNMLGQILDINRTGSLVKFDRVAIISDRDEVSTETDFIGDLTKKFSDFKISFSSDPFHNNWSAVEYRDSYENSNIVHFLPLIIPFEDTGAIETFLLNALSFDNDIDRKVIEQCNTFIDNIDCKDSSGNKKYLRHRREITKAKFDAAFVVMTPVDAFGQRRTILRSVPWEQYESIQESFKQLSKLSENDS